ncbi:MAG: hypothetical protein J6J38_06760 [Lachnospiraceae bacterium]|nr:hypothetical protein [Lachnospiraceae bacterium]
MMKKVYNGLLSRAKLAEELAKQYIEKNAPSVACISGKRGTGKSFVMDTLLNKLKDEHTITIYKSFGDGFVKFGSGSSKSKINSVSFSAGTPLFALGLGIGWDNNDNDYIRLRNRLSKILVSDVLFGVDDFMDADSEVKKMIMLISKNLERLQKEFKVTINLLITNIDSDYMPFLGSKKVFEYMLGKYEVSDVSDFLHQKYKLIVAQEEDVLSIYRICGGNLKLVEFIYEEKYICDKEYLNAIEQIVKRRIEQLKESGKKEKLNEDELEAVIYSASLSVKKFTTQILAEVVNQEHTTVYRELDLAQEERFLTRDYNDYYEFFSFEIKSQIEKQTIQKRKDWLLSYYNYYTKNEQDEYYYRAYYLMKYQEKVTLASFTLFMLAYSSAWEMHDFSTIEKIKQQFQKANISEAYEDLFNSIEEFYSALSFNKDYDEVQKKYDSIDKDELDIPLKAELTRAFFHYLYINTNMSTSKELLVLEQCKEYALTEVCVDIRGIDLITPTDETVIRLRIIYDIAPCILDCLNQYESFHLLYEKSKELTRCSSCSRNGHNIGNYIENVFNRKAFLFVNQTQCDIYYHKAKKFFKENEIWDEYCITLVCEAGTDIVIQRYNEAISCCNKAISVCEEKNIQLPLMEKLYNNRIVATFLAEEGNTQNQKKLSSAAKKAIKELKQLLMSRQCATEYVILTNICSLSLYCDNDKQYLLYKKKFEKLYGCQDISNIDDLNIDDFYRYYFSWFELYRNIRNECWSKAEILCTKLDGFVPALFRKQDVFWEQKIAAAKQLIKSKQSITAYDFCNNLVKCTQREKSLAYFFHRGLMLSDLQYTSYI